MHIAKTSYIKKQMANLYFLIDDTSGCEDVGRRVIMIKEASCSAYSRLNCDENLLKILSASRKFFDITFVEDF